MPLPRATDQNLPLPPLPPPHASSTPTVHRTRHTRRTNHLRTPWPTRTNPVPPPPWPHAVSTSQPASSTGGGGDASGHTHYWYPPALSYCMRLPYIGELGSDRGSDHPGKHSGDPVLSGPATPHSCRLCLHAQAGISGLGHPVRPTHATRWGVDRGVRCYHPRRDLQLPAIGPPSHVYP